MNHQPNGAAGKSSRRKPVNQFQAPADAQNRFTARERWTLEEEPENILFGNNPAKDTGETVQISETSESNSPDCPSPDEMSADESASPVGEAIIAAAAASFGSLPENNKDAVFAALSASASTAGFDVNPTGATPIGKKSTGAKPHGKNTGSGARKNLSADEFLAASVAAEDLRLRAEALDQRLFRENASLVAEPKEFVWRSPIRTLSATEIADFFASVVTPAMMRIEAALCRLDDFKTHRRLCKFTCGIDVYTPMAPMVQMMQAEAPRLKTPPAACTYFRVKLNPHQPLTIEMRYLPGTAEKSYPRPELLLVREQLNLEDRWRVTEDLLVRLFAENFFVRRTHPAWQRKLELEEARRARNLDALHRQLQELLHERDPEMYPLDDDD